MANIKFGTSGWRGIVGQDFTFRMVRLALDATARVLQRRGVQGEILVSYDTRLLSGHGPETTVGEEKRTNPFVNGL